MKKNLFAIGIVGIIPFLFLSSCQVLETTFKAGAWTGILLILGIIGLILFLIGRNKKT